MNTKLLIPTVGALLLGFSTLACSSDWDHARGPEYRHGGHDQRWKGHRPHGWDGHWRHPRYAYAPPYCPPPRTGYGPHKPYRPYPSYGWGRPVPYQDGITIIYRGHF